MTPEERQPLIEEIRNYPTTIRQLVAPLTDEQLTAKPFENEWTIAQNVNHLADSHINSIVRLKLILTEDQPPLKPYDENAWVSLVDGSSTNLSPTLQILDGLHTRWANLFASLTEEQWQRTGMHAVDGEVSAEQLLQIYVEHGRAHIRQINRNLAALAA